MISPEKQIAKSERKGLPAVGGGLMIMLSICALILTFLISSSDADFKLKAIIFAVIFIVYLIFSGSLKYLQKRRGGISGGNANEHSADADNAVFDARTDEKLAALEEANAYFAASLKIEDAFRLVADRIGELVPFAACALFLIDEKDSNLKVVCVAGKGAVILSENEPDTRDAWIEKAFQTGVIQFAESLENGASDRRENSGKELFLQAAVPLTSENGIYGVLGFFDDTENKNGSPNVLLLEAVETRVSPLFAKSVAYGRSLENALIDSLTNLPNERAFFLVLENQIAESQRFRERRPLSVLSIDIKGFDELNRKYGHATGDRVLIFAAKIIKTQLRQMDFPARAAADEFLAILPTASEEITLVIIERIEAALRLNSFECAENEKIFIELNFGAASFIADGETATDLLKSAVLKRRESKNDSENRVLWFPREYIN